VNYSRCTRTKSCPPGGHYITNYRMYCSTYVLTVAMRFGFTNVQTFTFFLVTYILLYTSITVIPLFTQLPNYTSPG